MGLQGAVGAGHRMARAAEADLAAMVATFSQAFADDPGLSWIWPDRADRLQRLPHFFDAIVRGTLSAGVALRSEAATAVSLWRRPERIHPDDAETRQVLPSLARAFDIGGERSQLMSSVLKRHQPATPGWWYLQFIGVRPEAQGSGLGGAAIRAGLDLAGSGDAPVYVEVMNPANLGYYRHIGFETVSEFDIPDDGPHVWGMVWRDRRAAPASSGPSGDHDISA